MAQTLKIAVSHRAFGSPRRTLSGLLAHVFSVRAQRRKLARLDDEALNDLGITRSEAEREARRPIWDVPSHWRR